MTGDAARETPASKARDRFFIALVSAFVLAVMTGYAFTYATGRSFSRIDFGMAPSGARGVSDIVRPWTDLLGVTEQVSGHQQAELADFARTEFLGYDRLVLGYSAAVSAANRTFYGLLRPNDPVVPVGFDNANMFQEVEWGGLTGITLANDEVVLRAVQDAKAARDLERRFPDLHFAYYGVSSWTMTPRAREAGYPDPVRSAWTSFSDRVGTGRVGLFTPDDWGSSFFRTDHHWSPKGAYQGYLGAIALLQAQNRRIGDERMPFRERVLPNVVYRGASVRRAALVEMAEPFQALLPPEQGVRAYIGGARADWVLGNTRYFTNPPKGLFVSHYHLYNGGDYSLIHYVAQGDGGRLLILGDSFSNSMEHLVASHFEHTYSIDLRYWQGQRGEPFDMKAFVEEQGITDVLIIGRPTRVMDTPAAVLRGVPVQ